MKRESKEGEEDMTKMKKKIKERILEKKIITLKIENTQNNQTPENSYKHNKKMQKKKKKRITLLRKNEVLQQNEIQDTKL